MRGLARTVLHYVEPVLVLAVMAVWVVLALLLLPFDLDRRHHRGD